MSPVASGGCAQPEPAAQIAFQKVSDAQAFRTLIVGRTFREADSEIRLTPEGGVEGATGARPIVGVWTWSERGFRRSATVAGRALPDQRRCWEVAGDAARLTRADGALIT